MKSSLSINELKNLPDNTYLRLSEIVNMKLLPFSVRKLHNMIHTGKIKGRNIAQRSSTSKKGRIWAIQLKEINRWNEECC